jgi:hypothetical protein
MSEFKRKTLRTSNMQYLPELFYQTGRIAKPVLPVDGHLPERKRPAAAVLGELIRQINADG